MAGIPGTGRIFLKDRAHARAGDGAGNHGATRFIPQHRQKRGGVKNDRRHSPLSA